MIEVKNLLFQPLTFQLADGTSLHLGPRERRTIASDLVSPELEQAQRRNYVDLRETEQPKGAAPVEIQSESPAKVISGGKRTRKGK